MQPDEPGRRVRGDEGLELLVQPIQRREAAPPYHQSGCLRSSSILGLASVSGAKKAGGSPVWMATGRPSSPAAVHRGSKRRSLTAIRRPETSRSHSPRFFQTLIPTAPRCAATRRSRSSAASEPGAPT